LSIIDLSPDGKQPKTSPSSRYVISFNGEIYNCPELSEEIGHRPRGGTSDTAVLLEAFDQWGIEACLPKLIGMFAIAIWDRERSRLWLIRDHLGIKPLYYGWQGETLWFGSELSITRSIPNFSAKIYHQALGLLLKRSCIGGEHTIYKDWAKCLPGEAIFIEQGQLQLNKHRFWSAKESALKGIKEPFEGDYHEAVETLEKKLSNSVRMHMAADVPLGAFLSGGIDSSLVCALAQQHSHQPLKTFTIGFNDEVFNEAQHAKSIAQHLCTDHHELYLDPETMLSSIEDILNHAQEPFADSSLIPTSLVSKMTREHVTVSLSGDGGDELFCGYPRFNWTNNLWEQLRLMPTLLKPLARRLLKGRSPQQWNKCFDFLKIILATPERQMGEKLHRLADMLHCSSAQELYISISSHLNDLSQWPLKTEAAKTILDGQDWRDLPHLKEQMMFADTVTYLPDDILTKVDRASMQHSLETRVPLLTPDTVSFAWSLPLPWREDKKILKDVLYRHLPREMMERPKMGFGIPLAQWLSGPLKPWVDAKLNQNRLQREGYFKEDTISHLWSLQQKGQQDSSYALWNICCFQQWLEQQNFY
jgi:asparagine synthase (glutamine-hydrolysing)